MKRNFFSKREANYRQRGKKLFWTKDIWIFFFNLEKMNERTLQEKIQRRFFLVKTKSRRNFFPFFFFLGKNNDLQGLGTYIYIESLNLIKMFTKHFFRLRKGNSSLKCPHIRWIMIFLDLEVS